MEKGIEPDAFAWNAALIACGRANETASAVQVFQQMTEHGQKPGVVSYGALLSALEKGNLLENAEQVCLVDCNLVTICIRFVCLLAV